MSGLEAVLKAIPPRDEDGNSTEGADSTQSQGTPGSDPSITETSTNKKGVKRGRGGKRQEEEEKKRQIRLIKNRQSAALSRQRKKEYVTSLQQDLTRANQENSNIQSQVSRLTTQNWECRLHVERLEKEVLKLVGENADLRSQLRDYGADVDPKPRELDVKLYRTNSKGDNAEHNLKGLPAVAHIVAEELSKHKSKDHL